MFNKTHSPILSVASRWRTANGAKSASMAFVAVLMLLAFLCAACQSTVSPESAISPTHEIGLTSTATLEPTPTSTFTLTPEPTLTPTPTLTPVPILILDGLELIWGNDYVEASFLPNQTEGVTRTFLTKDMVSVLDGVSLLPWVGDDLTISTRDLNGNLYLPHPDVIGIQGTEDLMTFDAIDEDGFAVFTDTSGKEQNLPAQIRVPEGFDGEVLLATESTGENEKIVRVVVWSPDGSMYIYVVSDDSVTHGQWSISPDGILYDGEGKPLDGWVVGENGVRDEIEPLPEGYIPNEAYIQPQSSDLVIYYDKEHAERERPGGKGQILAAATGLGYPDVYKLLSGEAGDQQRQAGFEYMVTYLKNHNGLSEITLGEYKVYTAGGYQRAGDLAHVLIAVFHTDQGLVLIQIGESTPSSALSEGVLPSERDYTFYEFLELPDGRMVSGLQALAEAANVEDDFVPRR